MSDYHGIDIDKCYISGCQCGKPKFDDLRTRVARAIGAEVYGDIGNSDLSLAARAADAVIAELGLREEAVAFANGPLNGFKTGFYAGCTGNGVNRRYVTEWTADE